LNKYCVDSPIITAVKFNGVLPIDGLWVKVYGKELSKAVELRQQILNNQIIVGKIGEKIKELEPLTDFPSQVTRATLEEILNTILSNKGDAS